MQTLVVLTGSELRHEFFRKYLSNATQIQVLKTICEANENSVDDLVKEDQEYSIRKQHLAQRRQSEIDFFELYCQRAMDYSNPCFVAKGDINLNSHVNEIIELNPDLIIAYGCSIVKPPLIEAFQGRFINIHLGLSPYYRGSGTNFWPFVNNEPEFAGVTFMHINEGIDTGKILHQIQAAIHYGDNIHQIGNRLIKDMAKVCVDLVQKFSYLGDGIGLHHSSVKEKVYRKKDFTDAAVKMMYANFSNGMIENYLNDIRKGKRRLNIITNASFKNNLVSI